MRENVHQPSALWFRLLIFLSLLLFSYPGAYAQKITPSSTNLDIKNGFSKFELGTSVNEARKIAKIRIAGKNTYRVTSPQDFPLFGYQPKSILLSYTNGLLNQTTVSLTMPSLLKEQISMLDNILNGYESIYGKWIDLGSHDSILVQRAITGKKVQLIFTLYKEGKEQGATFVFKQL